MAALRGLLEVLEALQVDNALANLLGEPQHRHQWSRMATFSACTMPLCTLEKTFSCQLSIRRAMLQESGIARR